MLTNVLEVDYLFFGWCHSLVSVFVNGIAQYGVTEGDALSVAWAYICVFLACVSLRCVIPPRAYLGAYYNYRNPLGCYDASAHRSQCVDAYAGQVRFLHDHNSVCLHLVCFNIPRVCSVVNCSLD